MQKLSSEADADEKIFAATANGWRPITERLKQGLTFDDITLSPRPSEVLPAETNTSTLLCRGIRLAVPFVSSPMDTVTEERMVIAKTLCGGAGVLHRAMTEREMLQKILHIKRFMAGKIDDPVVVYPSMTLGEVELLNVPYTGFPVVKKNNNGYGAQPLVGIITRRDTDGKPPSTKVKDVMTPLEKLRVASPDIDFTKALAIMQQYKIEKLPLVDSDWVLKGLVTRRDVNYQLKYPNATTDARGRLRVGAALGSSNTEATLEFVQQLIDAGVDFVVIDSSHGGHQRIVETARLLKESFPELPVIAGNVADRDSALELLRVGADALRVGIGSGSSCTTRIVTGFGVPQLSAIQVCREAVEAYSNGEVPIISDGGISEPHHVVKALVAGASSVMLGNLLARTEEAPGGKITRGSTIYKPYRGMGSEAAMREHRGDRYFESGEGKMTAEGVSGLVPLSGSVKDLIEKYTGALRNAMGYAGARTIAELWSVEGYINSFASMREARPHDLIIEGENPAGNDRG